MTDDTWREELLAEREGKDHYFREDPRSPIPQDEREAFDGLSYFPPDPDYRFELPLVEHDDPEAITIGTSTEGEREYLDWGEFRFAVDGEEETIHAYKADSEDDRLWVPFRDETSGEETYGAGRYLDLTPEDRTDEGRWILDFNRAYNPFCAYSAAYECPLVPMENWLDVRVEAGEKSYEGAEAHDPA